MIGAAGRLREVNVFSGASHLLVNIKRRKRKKVDAPHRFWLTNLAAEIRVLITVFIIVSLFKRFGNLVHDVVSNDLFKGLV